MHDPGIATSKPKLASVAQLSDIELAEEIERSARDDLCSAWFPRSIDPTGGYVEYFDHEWRPKGDTRRCLIHQARLAWSAAAFAGHDPARRDEYAGYALHGIRFIDTVLRDEKHGGFYFDVDSGRKPYRNGEKHAVAIGYAIFAGARAFMVTGDSTALAVGRDGMAWLARHSRGTDGSHVENLSREGDPLTRSYSRSRHHLFGLLRTTPRRDPLSKLYGQTTMNTHIHLLEAYTEMFRADPAPDSRAALRTILHLVRDYFVDRYGILYNRLDGPERKREQVATYGHAVETAALILDAAAALGEYDDPETQHQVNAMAELVLQNGRDGRHGGTFENPSRDGGDKIWWVLGEALNTWAVMYGNEVRGRGAPVEGSQWRRALAGEWQFIRDHMIDRRNGGWFSRVRRDGSHRKRYDKSDNWTDLYHNLRGLITASRTLRERGGELPAALD